MQFLGARHPPKTVQGSRHLAASLLLFVPLVFAGNQIGSILRYPDVGSAVLFVPYAVLTAALVVSRPRDWVWYILIDSIAHFVTHWPQWPMSWVLLATVANIARALAAAVLVARLCDGIPRFVGVRTLWCFVVGAVIVAPSIGASIGAANVVLHGASDDYWRPWRAWFTSNALTAFTMLPACMALFSYTAEPNRPRVERRRLVEGVLVTAALCATAAFILLGSIERTNPAVTLFAALPTLFWSALRFGAAGASGALTVITFAAIWSVDRGETSAAGPSDGTILGLQFFMFFTAGPVLALAAIAAGREAVVQLHRALLASLHDHVALLDARGVMFEANASWRRFAESSAAPLHRARTGDDYLAACRSSAERGDVMGTALFDGVTKVLSGAEQHVEIEYDDPEPGRHETYAIRIESLERPDGGAVVTRANVTARRQAQLEIERHRRELSHLARVNLLGQLSGALAHDLNQPLTAILSNAQAAHKWLLRDPPNTEYATEILQDIIDDDRRAAAMIHRLRSLLKRGDLRVERIDAADLVSEALDLSRSELQARNIEPMTSINPAAPALLGDKVQLQQVLLNLILNACDAMNDMEEPRRRLELSVASDDLRTVRLSVRDWGVGLPTDLIERLFEPFVTTKSDGLGLGLSISRTIIAAHGGRLWAENNPGGGATIHCVLPVAEPPEVATAEPTSTLPDAVRH